VPVMLEDIKKDLNFDETLAILLGQISQPKQRSIPPLAELTRRICERVNPGMIAEADRWGQKDPAPAPLAAQQGDLRLRFTQEFQALLRRIVRTYSEASGQTLDNIEVRARTSRLKVEVVKGVATIAAPRKTKKKRR